MPNMDSIRLKTKELQSKMYLTQTHSSDSLTHWTHKSGQLVFWRLLRRYSNVLCSVVRNKSSVLQCLAVNYIPFKVLQMK